MIDNLPVGVNITGKAKDDDVVLNIANYVEKVTDLKDIYSKVGDIDV